MEITSKITPDPKLKLMEQIRQVLRYHHYTFSTERNYAQWIIRFIKHFDNRIHPRNMAVGEIEQCISHLATREKVSEATQRTALNAIILLKR